MIHTKSHAYEAFETLLKLKL